MSLRCAVCGSKRITAETRKEGYDVVKGVVGTALIGIPGALAGAGGKENTYYHCADCGQVMNKTMLSVESNWIDMLLEDSANWESQLKEKKAKYKNIEWEDKSVSEKELGNLTKKEAIAQIEDKILEYLNQIGTLVEEHKIHRHLAGEDWNGNVADALNNLYFSGKVEEEYLDSKKSYIIVKDAEKVKQTQLGFEAHDVFWELQPENKEKWAELIWDSMETHKKYTWEELYEVTKIVFLKIYDNLTLVNFIISHTVLDMVGTGMVAKENEIYYARTLEEAELALQEIEKKKQEEKRKKEEERKKAIEKLKQNILSYLEANFGKYRAEEMKKNSSQFSKYAIYELSDVLKEMVEQGTIEKIVENRRDYFAIAGYEEKRREKEREAAEKRRIAEEARKAEERRRKEQRRVDLEKEIEKLKKQKTEQEIIVNENQRKWFGQGAKAKKAAQKEIENLDNKIFRLQMEISNIR